MSSLCSFEVQTKKEEMTKEVAGGEATYLTGVAMLAFNGKEKGQFILQGKIRTEQELQQTRHSLERLFTIISEKSEAEGAPRTISVHEPLKTDTIAA